MRLLIPSCRYCLYDKAVCKYRKKIKPAVNAIDESGTMTHRCPVYWTLIPKGTRVKVELKELDVGEGLSNGYEPPEPWAEWKSAGWVEGTVVGKSTVGTGFFLIELDKPVSLCIPERNGSWFDAKETEVTYRAKRAKDIEVLQSQTKI